MVVTCEQMQRAEAVAFARGVRAEDLMEEAGLGIAQVVRQFFPGPGHVVLFLGKGNNAGDALVAARYLLEAGWTVSARLAFPAGDFKPLPARHWAAISKQIVEPGPVHDWAPAHAALVLLDGLLGVGAAPGPLRGELAAAVREMNELRRSRQAFTAALDIPSGLDSVSGMPGDPCVRADLTVTIAHAKAPLLADEATGFVGRLAVLPLAGLPPCEAKGDLGRRLLTPEVLRLMLPRRAFEFHKGEAGRVGVIAGSRGYLGAALLAAEGALRGGAGLTTLYVKEDIYPHIAARAPREVMVKAVRHYEESLEDRMDALAIGPGLGAAAEAEVLAVVARAPVPVVLDADALNMLARSDMESLRARPAPTLLTPHPGEMARLRESFRSQSGPAREAQARELADRYGGTTVLLKGARTVIAGPGMPASFNTTGHPGMASGGMGDVLTGLCAALAAQGVPLPDAACLGAWLSGRAAELSLISGRCSEESLLAGDVLASLGQAFTALRRGSF